MLKKIKLQASELVVDEPLAWSIYDIEGKLLLSAGQIISSKEKLDSLCQHELFRHETAGDTRTSLSPFEQLDGFAVELGRAFDELEAGNPDAKERLEHIATGLAALCDAEPDALLGAVHVPNEMTASLFQPLQCAILCDLMIRHKDVTRDARVSTVGAALTSNIALRGFYEQLQKQDTPISATQRRLIAQHPKKSTMLVSEVGIKDANWLKVILHHHELSDGSGYPANLKGEQIVLGAKALAIAERYSIMLSKNRKNEQLSINDALKTFFVEEGKKYDNNLSLQLVLALTVFPPGSFVRLANGETAVVIRRVFEEPMKPQVKSITDAEGHLLEEYIERDSGDDEYEIKGVCRFENTASLDLNKLWGF